jgi:hypothetical protein
MMNNIILEQITLYSGYSFFGSTAGDTSEYGLTFNFVGRLIESDRTGTSTIGNWVNTAPSPTGTYWIRASGFTAGSEYTSSSIVAGTWNELNASRSVLFEVGPYEFFTESVTIDIASDSSGSTILDTTTLTINLEDGS